VSTEHRAAPKKSGDADCPRWKPTQVEIRRRLPKKECASASFKPVVLPTSYKETQPRAEKLHILAEEFSAPNPSSAVVQKAVALTEMHGAVTSAQSGMLWSAF
jgi:hypothetical protein